MRTLFIGLMFAALAASACAANPATSASVLDCVIDTRLCIIINSLGLSKIDTVTKSGMFILLK